MAAFKRNCYSVNSFSLIFKLLTLLYFQQVNSQSNKLCTVEGLQQSVRGWSTLIQIPLLSHALRLNQTELFLEKAVLKTLPPSALNFNSKLFANAKDKFVFTSTQKKSLTYLLYNPNPEDGGRVIGAQIDPTRADPRIFPFVPIWTSSPLDTKEYCYKFHAKECSLPTPTRPTVNEELSTYWIPNLDGARCPLYCTNFSSFGSNIINFDLNVLFAVEDAINTLMSGTVNNERLTINTLRNVTMIAPSFPFPDALIALASGASDSSSIGIMHLGTSPLMNPRKRFSWGDPVRTIDSSNLNQTVMSLAITKPVYLFGSHFGGAALVLRMNMTNAQYEEFLSPSKGFCLVMTTSAYLVSGSLKAIDTINPLRIQDFNLTTSLFPDLNRFAQKVIDSYIEDPNAFYSQNRTAALSDLNKDPINVNFDTILTKPVKDFPTERVLIGESYYVVSYVQLQVIPWYFMCFADENELLYSGSHHIENNSFSSRMTSGQSSWISIKMINNGKLNLSTSLTVSPSLSSPWLYLSNITSSSSNPISISVTTNQTNKDKYEWISDRILMSDQITIENIQINTTIEIILMIDSSTMTQGALTEVGLVMTTTDSSSGWCYDKQESVKISVMVDWKIDDLIFVEWDSSMGILFAFFTTFFMLILVCLLLFTFKMRSNPWFKAINPLFVQVMMIGSLIGLSSVYFWIGEPNKLRCNGRVWFASIGFGLMFSTLLVKNYRIFKIMKNISSQNHTMVTELSVSPFIIGCVVVEIIILIIWISINPLEDKLIGNKSYLSKNQNEKVCDGDNLLLWLLLLFIFNGGLLLIGCYLAFILRKVHDKLNESRLIAGSIYNITLTSFVIIPLELFADISPNVKLILIGIGAYSAYFVVVMALFTPLIWKTIFKNDMTPKHEITGNSSGSHSSSGNSKKMSSMG